MNYIVDENKIIVKTENFDPKSIFECGQTFSFRKIGDVYFTFPEDKLAAVYLDGENYVVECLAGDTKFFINYFDLERDYQKIILEIEKINASQEDFDRKLIEKSLKFGRGIRILKQELVETIVSFIFSANNNIKRFTASLNQLRQDFGNEISIENEASQRIKELISSQKFFSFPNLKALLKLDEAYFSKIGAGYRAPYLFETIKALPNFLAEDFSFMSTDQLLKELVSLKGIGRKVAQCVMLFGFGRVDCFPVDTWIKQVYNDLNMGEGEKNEQQISSHLIKIFGNYSGYAQQYLFYYKRELKQLV